MRKLSATVLVLTLALVGGSTVRVDARELDGQWKLSTQRYGDEDYLILYVKTARGKPTASVVSSQPFLGAIEGEAAEVAAKGDDVTVTFPVPGEPMVFHGTVKN